MQRSFLTRPRGFAGADKRHGRAVLGDHLGDAGFSIPAARAGAKPLRHRQHRCAAKRALSFIAVAGTHSILSLLSRAAASVAGVFPGGGSYGVAKTATITITEAIYQEYQAKGAKCVFLPLDSSSAVCGVRRWPLPCVVLRTCQARQMPRGLPWADQDQHHGGSPGPRREGPRQQRPAADHERLVRDGAEGAGPDAGVSCAAGHGQHRGWGVLHHRALRPFLQPAKQPSVSAC